MTSFLSRSCQSHTFFFFFFSFFLALKRRVSSRMSTPPRDAPPPRGPLHRAARLGAVVLLACASLLWCGDPARAGARRGPNHVEFARLVETLRRPALKGKARTGREEEEEEEERETPNNGSAPVVVAAVPDWGLRRLREGRPMRLVAAGLSRSGSTWQFNALRLLLRHAVRRWGNATGPVVVRSAHGHAIGEVQDALAHPYAVVKIHEYTPDVLLRVHAVLVTHRDLRDAWPPTWRRFRPLVSDDCVRERDGGRRRKCLAPSHRCGAHTQAATPSSSCIRSGLVSPGPRSREQSDQNTHTHTI